MLVYHLYRKDILVYNLYRSGHVGVQSLQERTCWCTISTGEDILVYHLYRRAHVGIQSLHERT